MTPKKKCIFPFHVAAAAAAFHFCTIRQMEYENMERDDGEDEEKKNYVLCCLIFCKILLEPYGMQRDTTMQYGVICKKRVANNKWFSSDFMTL